MYNIIGALTNPRRLFRLKICIVLNRLTWIESLPRLRQSQFASTVWTDYQELFRFAMLIYPHYLHHRLRAGNGVGLRSELMRNSKRVSELLPCADEVAHYSNFEIPYYRDNLQPEIYSVEHGTSKFPIFSMPLLDIGVFNIPLHLPELYTLCQVGLSSFPRWVVINPIISCTLNQ